MIFTFFIASCALVIVNGYVLQAGNIIRNVKYCGTVTCHGVTPSLFPSQLLAKKDLFADDLFNDDEGVNESTPKEIVKEEPPKRKYLDEKWSLSEEDAKEFKGFPRKVPPSDPSAPKTIKNVPLFALMFKFRREYKEGNIESSLADHVAQVKKNKRILSSEVINMTKAKGVVTLWAGLTESDHQETREEITKFVESNPFISKDMIETWDVIDLSKTKSSNELPLQAGKVK